MRLPQPKTIYYLGLGLAALLVVDRLRRRKQTDAETAGPVVDEPAAPVEVEERFRATPPATTSAGDDLTQIKGVGPTYARRLKEAGLTSYADIAAASVEKLREATGTVGRATVDPTDWIAQARSMS